MKLRSAAAAVAALSFFGLALSSATNADMKMMHDKMGMKTHPMMMHHKLHHHKMHHMHHKMMMNKMKMAMPAKMMMKEKMQDKMGH